MRTYISIFLIIIFLSSCSPAGRFGAGVDITFDPRTIGMQIDDTIMQKNLVARLSLSEKKYFLSIQVEVLDGRIFLSGKVDKPEEKLKQTVKLSLLLFSGLYLVERTSNKVLIEICLRRSSEVLSTRVDSMKSSFNS